MSGRSFANEEVTCPSSSRHMTMEKYMALRSTMKKDSPLSWSTWTISYSEVLSSSHNRGSGDFYGGATGVKMVTLDQNVWYLFHLRALHPCNWVRVPQKKLGRGTSIEMGY